MIGRFEVSLGKASLSNSETLIKLADYSLVRLVTLSLHKGDPKACGSKDHEYGI